MTWFLAILVGVFWVLSVTAIGQYRHATGYQVGYMQGVADVNTHYSHQINDQETLQGCVICEWLESQTKEVSE